MLSLFTIQIMPGRVRVSQRIILDIAVAIKALKFVWVGNHIVRTHEPPDQRVINPPVHVDDSHLIEVLMLGIAAIGLLAHDRIQVVRVAW